MIKPQVGVDSIYQAPSGALVAYGLIKFSMGTDGGADQDAVALLRLNPFPPVPPGGIFPPGWSQVLTNINAQSIARDQQRGEGVTTGTDRATYEEYMSNGDMLYFFAGVQTAGGQLVSAFSSAGAAGLPDGYWCFRASAVGQTDTGQGGASLGTIPPLGSAPGTVAADASDWAWAVSQYPTWSSGRSQWAQTNPFNALTSGSPSTLSQVAPVTAAAAPSNNQLVLYALVAAAIGLLWYEFD